MKLDILDLHVEVAGREVIKELNLKVAQGECTQLWVQTVLEKAACPIQ